MDTKMDKDGRAVALTTTGNASKISTRSTRKKKTTLITPKRCIEFIQSKHSSKNFENGTAELFKETYIESPTFFNYFKPANKDKNFSKNVWLYDATRVQIPDVDYYHASYVEGLRPNQYILAQAPMNTSQQKEFVKMLQHVKAEAVVVVDAADDCGTFLFNKKEGDKVGLKVSSDKSTDDWSLATISASGLKDVKCGRINKWSGEKFGETELVEAHEKIRKYIGWGQKNPIVVVCKDGATKSGIWALIDTEADRFRDKTRVKLTDTLKTIRNYRSNCFDSMENFQFACSTMIEWCKKNNKK
ncbi:unnamed protein product [Caenorhabditis angaria]|uniref:Tyrosine-protein phosphatase domain-containing protein n=1 Tax=Caenorhabditis angaria TaxID=860376 RepID=A0A9P1ILH7_9PELO|nr:unnamed protein product [Caenorhabditis angaria]